MSKNLIVSIITLFFLNISIVFSETIKDVEINGNNRLTNNTIEVLGEINRQKNYDENELNNLVKKLYETKFFKEVSARVNQNILVITLIENPIIEDIQIEGIKQNSIRELLLDRMNLKSRKAFDELTLKEDLNLILNILKTSGYYFAKISSSTEINKNLNTVRLKLIIDQGKLAKIKKINCIGDKKIKDKKLFEIIASEEHKFWKFISKNVYVDQSRINLDIRLIENYYKNLGYYNVKVLSSFAEFNKLGNFNLTYNIEAGELYYFNNLKLNLPKDYNVNDFKSIQDQFDKLKGKKYSIDSFNDILSNIEKIASLRLYDFIDAKVKEEFVENNKINFEFNVSDSTNYYVENINIFGNYTTIEEVIRNKLIVNEGDPLNKILYNRSIDNLKSLGIFKNVDAKIYDGSSDKLKKIDITVEEKPTGEISLAAGVGTSGSTIGGGITENNFLGKGISLNTYLELSEETIKGQFVYSRPNFAYTDNTLITSLSNTKTDNLSDFGYKLSATSFKLGTEFEQFENLFYSPSISFSHENLETNSTASSKLKKQEGTYNDIYYNYGLNYDLRDSKFRPTSGNRTSFYQELPIISDGSEILNSINFDQYKTISKNLNLIGKGSFLFKAVNSFDSSRDVRISKRLNIPYNRLRGFERGKIGPVENNDYIGGNYVSALNLSTNLPFLLPSLDVFDFSYFIDAANVWGVDYNNSLDDSGSIRSSTGLGIDILTPIGPLSFSFTKPITKKSSDKTESFRFNLGTNF